MASIIDSFRETFGDRFSIFKIIILTIPVFYSYQIFVNEKGFSQNFIWTAGITLFFIFGIFVQVISNVINERDRVIPALNPISIAFASIKCLASIGPAIFIWCWLANYACSMINIIPWLDITLKTILWLVAASAIVTALLLYSKEEKIKDGYNIKMISDKAGDLIVVLLFLVLQLIVINAVTAGFLGYTISVLFGMGPFFYFFLGFAIVFNIIAAAHYLGQAHYEVICYSKIDKK